MRTITNINLQYFYQKTHCPGIASSQMQHLRLQLQTISSRKQETVFPYLFGAERFFATFKMLQEETITCPLATFGAVVTGI